MSFRKIALERSRLHMVDREHRNQQRMPAQRIPIAGQDRAAFSLHPLNHRTQFVYDPRGAVAWLEPSRLRLSLARDSTLRRFLGFRRCLSHFC
jgi:hypothetical protein